MQREWDSREIKDEARGSDNVCDSEDLILSRELGEEYGRSKGWMKSWESIHSCEPCIEGDQNWPDLKDG
jgi:hypothetical protein